MTEHLPKEITSCLNDLEQHYSDFERVERGGNGYLWFAKNKISQARVAIKFYAGESGDRRHDEPKLLCQLQSVNILPIYEARNVSVDWAYFITPRCAGGDLDDQIKSQPSVYESVDIVLGISNGVSAIHAQGMVHRDLKPGNIVMDGGIPRIADFGTVRVLDPQSGVATISQHSPLYRPPETWSCNTYTRAGDVYQLGLVAYQLLGGRVHYDGRNYLSAAQHKTYEAIEDPVDQSLFVDSVIRSKAENGTLADFSSLPPWITPAAKKALRAMLHPNPEQRLQSMSDLTAAMHKLRGDTDNWSFKGDVARLEKGGKLFELRPKASMNYEAFQQKTGSFRRVPGVQPGTLAALIKSCSRL